MFDTSRPKTHRGKGEFVGLRVEHDLEEKAISIIQSIIRAVLRFIRDWQEHLLHRTTCPEERYASIGAVAVGKEAFGGIVAYERFGEASELQTQGLSDCSRLREVGTGPRVIKCLTTQRGKAGKDSDATRN